MSRESARDPAIDALVADEREAIAPAVALERVWARVSASVLTAPPSAPPATPPATVRWLGVHPLAAVAVSFLVGSVAGGATVAWLGGRHTLGVTSGLSSPPVATLESSLRGPVPTASGVNASPPAPNGGSGARGPSPPAAFVGSGGTTHGSTGASPAASTLSEERALLDSARGALGRGEGARALAIIAVHQRRFVRPQLGEEREAIAIQALVVAGLYAEARARAARFRASSPDSLFAPAVEASLGLIP